MNKNLLSISEHAYRLSKIIIQLDSNNKNWILASEWLHLSSSINNIEIITESFDDSIMYCEPSINYENERSRTLEKFVLELSVFNFIWGSFETMCKIINPKKVPNTIKRRRSVIDDILFFLKNNFPLISTPPVYTSLLKELETIIKEDPDFKDIDFNILHNHELYDNSGKALAIIRLIRNDFAHGSLGLPEPEDWNYNSFSEKNYLKKIQLSSRLLLLTQQMILISYYKDNTFDVLNINTSNEYINIIELLYKLHINISSFKVDFGLFYKV